MAKSHHANGHKANRHSVLEIDLVGLFGQLGENSDDGLTTKEWQDLTGLSEKKMRESIRAAVEAGKLEPVQKFIPASEHWTGRNKKVPAYRVVE